MLVENKYFECEKCGEYCMRLIFAPDSATDSALRAFTEIMRSDFEQEHCEVWVIAPQRVSQAFPGHNTVWQARRHNIKS